MSAFYRAAEVGGCLDATLETRADGTQILRSAESLGWFPDRLTDSLEQWAAEAPERIFVAKRVHGGDWRRIRYATMLARVRAIGQALTDRGLSAERPVMILSDNDIEYLTLALGAMWAGVPCGPINRLNEVFDDPQVRHRGLRIDLPHPTAGNVAQVASPIRLSATPPEYASPPPLLGQHTNEILQELLGFPEEERARLREMGVIA